MSWTPAFILLSVLTVAALGQPLQAPADVTDPSWWTWALRLWAQIGPFSLIWPFPGHSITVITTKTISLKKCIDCGLNTFDPPNGGSRHRELHECQFSTWSCCWLSSGDDSICQNWKRKMNEMMAAQNYKKTPQLIDFTIWHHQKLVQQYSSINSGHIPHPELCSPTSIGKPFSSWSNVTTVGSQWNVTN